MALVWSVLPALAQSEFPNIVGVWKFVDGEVITHEGKVLPLSSMPESEVVIVMQEGPLFQGSYRWAHPEGTVLHDGEDITHRAEETLLGVFAGDGRTFTMADTPDTGYWFGSLTENGQMELRYVESGPFAAVGYSLLERQD